MHPLFIFLLRPRRILFVFAESGFPLFRAPILIHFEFPAAICCVCTYAYAARVRFIIRVGGGGGRAPLRGEHRELTEVGAWLGLGLGLGLGSG